LDRISDAASDIIRDGQAQNRAPATVNRHLALLRRLGKLAYQWGWTDKQLGGRVVNGVGADPDIVVASAKAYLAALNKLHSKTERVAAQG
jgi:hypothetical protein